MSIVKHEITSIQSHFRQLHWLKVDPLRTDMRYCVMSQCTDSKSLKNHKRRKQFMLPHECSPFLDIFVNYYENKNPLNASMENLQQRRHRNKSKKEPNWQVSLHAAYCIKTHNKNFLRTDDAPWGTMYGRETERIKIKYECYHEHQESSATRLQQSLNRRN